MYSKEFALNLKNKLERDGIFLVSSESDFILGFTVIKYYYLTKEQRESHSEKMIKLGYDFDEKLMETIYMNFYKPDERVSVYCGIYEKKINNLL